MGNKATSRGEEAKFIDIAVPGDSRVKNKEVEGIEEFQFRPEEIGELWKLKKVRVVPIVDGALGAVSDMFEKYAGKLNITIRLEVIQKAVLLGKAGILRKFLAI